jgi:hypothetical protein
MSRPVLLAVLVLASTLACRVEPPFERSNPHDPGSIYDLRLAGPDTIRTAGAVAQMTIVADPPVPYDDFHVQWEAEDWFDWPEPVPDDFDPRGVPTFPAMVSQGNGVFTAVNTTAEHKQVFLRAQLGPDVTLGRPIVTYQHATSIALSCAPHTQPIVACDAAPRPTNQDVPVHVRLWDAGGIEVRDIRWAIQRGQVISRDALIAMALPVRLDTNGIVRARTAGPGSTWIIVRIDDAVDSVRLVVAP